MIWGWNCLFGKSDSSIYLWGINMKKKNWRKILHIFAWIGFVIYLVVMLYFLFFWEARSRGEFYQYNIKPFAEIKRCLDHLDRFIMVINLFGNIFCFVPLGFVLPVLTPKRWGIMKVTFVSMLSSVTVEVIQLFTRMGSFDVDDIILNTCGGFLGCVLFYLCRGIYRLIRKNRMDR